MLIVGTPKPALIEIRGVVSPSSVNRWLRSIDEARNRDQANLLILHIHSREEILPRAFDWPSIW